MEKYPNPYQYPIPGRAASSVGKLQWGSMEDGIGRNLNNNTGASSSSGHPMFEEEERSLVGMKRKGSGGVKVKKHKFAFQTRSQVDILDDGYRWRKYGQKAVKNNNFPRSYYKCTSQGCSVKKQVQRHARDEGIVVTTYEGVHTHHIEKPNDNFENILNQMQIYAKFDPS